MATESGHNWNPNNNFNSPQIECPPLDETAEFIAKGDINYLSRAITIGESHLEVHREWIASLLDKLVGIKNSTSRIAITGSPGVGKSTFVECMGIHIVNKGLKLAVLAVDPSSKVSGGSILGDKTRMSELAKHPLAYVRPSAIGQGQGGITSSIRESILLCEAANFDIVMIETVGVGQSETRIYDMVDAFVLLIDPGAGDELQGIKRGIIELADLIFITKAEQSPKLAAASKTAYESGMQILKRDPTGWSPIVELHDSLLGDYTESSWSHISEYLDFISKSDLKAQKRATQKEQWFKELLYERIQQQLMKDSTYTSLINKSYTGITNNQKSIPGAVQDIIKNKFH